MPDVKKSVCRQDWHYPSASPYWQDGIFVGNGALGSMAYAPQHLEWVFNKNDVFDPTIEEAMFDKVLPHKQVMELLAKQQHKNSFFLRDLESAPAERPSIRSTLSACQLRLRFWHALGWAAPPAPQVEQHLSLYDGVLTENIISHNSRIALEMFIPRKYDTCCMRIKLLAASSPVQIFDLVRPTAEILAPPEWKTQGNIHGFVQKLPGGKYSYAVAILLVPTHGAADCRVRQISRNAMEFFQQDSADIFLCIKSSVNVTDPWNKACDELKKLAASAYDELKAEHLAWWHNYWDNAYIDFGKYKKIQKYFTFALYSIASSYSRAPMPGLNGLTYGPINEQNPGVSFNAYTHDQNVQIPAMPFFPMNRTFLVESIADTYLNALPVLRKRTRELFDSPGVFLPLQMNQLGREYPVRHYRYTICGSAYTGLILAMAWKYSHDMELLKNKLYPLLREFTLFYANIMHKGDDGCYHLDWSVPPEIFTFTRDESSTVAMFKAVLETVLETSELLNRDRRYRKHWQDILDHYPAVSTTPDGALWAGPDIPLDHYFFGGHILYAYFPAMITEDTATALKTLELIDRESVERSFADFSGNWHPNHEWSLFLQTATRLYAGEKHSGWHGIERFLEIFGKENGLFSHDPVIIGDPDASEKNEKEFQKNTRRRWVDGSLLAPDHPDIPRTVSVTPNHNAKRVAPPVLEGASAFLYLASTAFLQSRNGTIKVFPGVPDDFTGAFDRLLAEGALVVSAKMVKGKVCWVKLQALQGGKYRLCNPFEPTGEYLEGSLKPGETVIFSSRKKRK